MSTKTDGLAIVYFPNGTSFEMFHDRCCRCAYYLDRENDNPRLPKTTPPHECCEWGILDRIYDCLITDRYGSGKSAHQPEDIDPETCPPTCKRFIERGDYDYHDIPHPPPPDVVGQMTFDDVNVPIEHVPKSELVEARQ